MKSQVKRNIRAGTGLSLIIGLSAALAQRANAQLVYGVSSGTGQLFSFNSASPGTLDSAVTLTGMANGEQISTIDYVSGVLYGLGDESHLYTINPSSGTCSLIGSGAFSPVLNGVDFGLTAGPGLFYVSSDLGQNLSLSIGGVATANPTYAGVSLTSLAYDPVNASLYGVSDASHSLYSLNPTTGAATFIGSLGLSFSEVGFTITSSGNAYLAGDLGNQTALFSVNLSSGALTTMGDIGLSGQLNDGLNGIAVGPVTVPEPGFGCLAALGSGILFLVYRKRRFNH